MARMTLRIAVGLPAYRGIIASNQVKMWVEFGGELARRGALDIKLSMIGAVDVCGVDRARNIIVAKAMTIFSDWVLMIDSDTWCEDGTALIRMIMEAPHDAAMVGAAVRTRGGGRGDSAPLNVYKWAAGSGNEPGRHEPCAVRDEIGTGYQSVDAIGGAVIAINLHHLVPTDIFKWHYYETGQSISEDLYFCHQLRARDKKIYVDTRVRTYHVDKAQVLSYAY